MTLSYLLAVLEPDRSDGSPSFFVRAEGAALRLVTGDWLEVDARTFEAQFDQAAEAEDQGEPSAALDLYRSGLRLYRGPYLTDADTTSGPCPTRDRLAARFVGGAVRAGELTLAAGNPDEALRLAGRAVEVERWSESAHRLCVAAHLARGDVRAAARRAMQTCLRQLDDLGVPPTEDTEIVLQRGVVILGRPRPRRARGCCQMSGKWAEASARPARPHGPGGAASAARTVRVWRRRARTSGRGVGRAPRGPGPRHDGAPGAGGGRPGCRADYVRSTGWPSGSTAHRPRHAVGTLPRSRAPASSSTSSTGRVASTRVCTRPGWLRAFCQVSIAGRPTEPNTPGWIMFSYIRG